MLVELLADVLVARRSVTWSWQTDELVAVVRRQLKHPLVPALMVD
jgi:hypothetical protein